MKYDVVIVGAGPAGSTAAKLLADQNIAVLLIDKAMFPREKPCGGGLPIRTLQHFPYLKTMKSVESYSYETQAFLGDFSCHATVKRQQPILAMVRRKDFDNELVQQAIASGATFQDGKKVIDITIHQDYAELTLEHGSSIRCKVVIGADGVMSTIAKQVGLCSRHRPVSVCIFQ